MMTFIKRHLPAFAVGSVLLGSFAFVTLPAFAAGPGPGTFQRPAVVGKVASVSGTTLTVTSQARPRDEQSNSTGSPTATTYTVNASGATVTKDGQSSTVSAIAVGDTVMVQGTVSGTTVTATTIRDGAFGGPRGMNNGGGTWNGHASSTPSHRFFASTTPAITGNGEPVIGGTVSAISGSTLTVTAKAGQTYTVDASNATITKPGTANATLANVSVGDSVVVQGTVNGNAVTASSVIDQGTPKSDNGAIGAVHNFFGAIGGFFTRLFGFF